MPLAIQKRRDWPIIVVGTTLLSLHSGYVCAAALSRYSVSVGSLSLTRLGVLVDKHEWMDFATLAGVTLSFFFGCLLSGMFIGKAKFKAVQPYGQMLVFEGVLLTLISTVFSIFEYFLFPMALAMGIQNSMCTAWGGAVVRTTHFTGVLTDIGIVTGLWARYKFRGERRVADCYLFSIFGYMVGALLGSFAIAHIPDYALFIPGISLRIIYRVMYKRTAYFQHYRRKKKEKGRLEKTGILEERELSPILDSRARYRETRSEASLVDI